MAGSPVAPQGPLGEGRLAWRFRNRFEDGPAEEACQNTKGKGGGHNLWLGCARLHSCTSMVLPASRAVSAPCISLPHILACLVCTLGRLYASVGVTTRGGSAAAAHAQQLQR